MLRLPRDRREHRRRRARAGRLVDADAHRTAGNPVRRLRLHRRRRPLSHRARLGDPYRRGRPRDQGHLERRRRRLPRRPDGGGGKVLRLRSSTDGTEQGTTQVEAQTTSGNLFTGTYAARVHLSDKPTSGRDGDHVVQTFFPISPSDSSENYSELDFEYLPNGGWGSVGPQLDNVSWYRADPPDRVHHTLERRLEGWHTMVITAMDGKVTYSLDGTKLFTSSGKYVPRERMDIHFSNWLIDLPFTGGPRIWDMKVDWVYYKADEAVSPKDLQETVDGFHRTGTDYVNTVPKP